jgi:hypothetical protein
MRVADEHGLATRLGGGGEELTQVVGADHGGFIDNHQCCRAELEFVVAQ